MQDLTGQRFNKLTVLKFSHFDKKKNSYWLCKCDCGNEKIVRRCHLTSGGVQSCGCVLLEGRATYTNGWRTHGLWQSSPRLCKIWDGMKSRCYKENDTHYKDYGARGIIVCEEWKNDFEKFREWALKNGYQENLTIDRINVNGSYCPENCRWATRKEQANNKRTNIYIDYKGERHTAAEWSKITGLGRGIIEKRYHKGLLPEEIFIPLRGFSKKRTFLSYNGETKSITAWSKILHIHLEKLKKLLEEKSFTDICLANLTRTAK